jgi:hypothetical protein
MGNVPVAPPAAPPQITEVGTSSQEVHAGDTFRIYVLTSTNVASVTANFANQIHPFTRLRYGVFHFAYQVPWTPFFLHRSYEMKIVARNAAGVEASRAVTITLR